MLLCDADGNLFPSEEPAFVASTRVMNRLLEHAGSERRFTPEALQAETLGKNFRAAAADLAPGVDLDDWVAEEKRAVTAHLRDALSADPEVREPLRRLAERFELAVVSSSALSRLDACFEVTGLAPLLPADRRFSAEDSLPRPVSKPDPAVYLLAGERLGVAPHEAIAIEDSVTGTTSAVAAGFPTVGNVQFVAAGEREERVAQLEAAGAELVVSSWRELEAVLAPITA
jgi:HAD superfamily hydrolase (TIGR01509 family)